MGACVALRLHLQRKTERPNKFLKNKYGGLEKKEQKQRCGSPQYSVAA